MCRLSWFLDPGGWSKTAAVGLDFIFPGICTLSLREDVILEWIFLPRKPNKKLKTYIEKISDLIHKVLGAEYGAVGAERKGLRGATRERTPVSLRFRSLLFAHITTAEASPFAAFRERTVAGCCQDRSSNHLLPLQLSESATATPTPPLPAAAVRLQGP
ncbi:hypothetical protein STEG23_020062 [Scotinomys teguina]